MMLNPQSAWLVAQERQQHDLRRAEQHRLLQELRHARPNPPYTARQRLLWRLGDGLIALGMRLTAQRRALAYQPPPEQNCAC